MHASLPDTDSQATSLADYALAALAAPLEQLSGTPELEFLRQRQSAAGARGRDWRMLLRRQLDRQHFAAIDRPLLGLRQRLGLCLVETLTVALALEVERQPMVGRALAHLQRPAGGSRPTLWLVDTAFADLPETKVSPAELVLRGAAVGSGLLAVAGADLPLMERIVFVPDHLLLALRGASGVRHGCELERGQQPLLLPRGQQESARRYALALRDGQHRSLAIRSASLREGRALAAAVAAELGAAPLYIQSDDLTALAPWLLASSLLPVFERSLGPSERFRFPVIPHYDGPSLLLSGPEGSVEATLGAALTWRVEAPGRLERELLWQHALAGDGALAATLAARYRHGPGRIGQLGELARQHATMQRRALQLEDVVRACVENDDTGLAALAEPLAERIPTEALIVSEALQRDLELLLLRCRSREDVARGLGASAVTRYRPGVRALLSGPSGTGKTLAAGWLATQLGLPLYRVDVASIVSKYIGETEKNLAQLLARAEHADALLLFDEADSLFGKRTEVKQANDRFANTQTNYLLQRIESYEGIVVLTTNSRARIDAAFTRRLDFVLEFGAPKPDERKRLWLAHLGQGHSLSALQLNQLSTLLDFSGGHIRNVVLCAAMIAREMARPIAWQDIQRGVAVEYRKLGKQVPAALSAVD